MLAGKIPATTHKVPRYVDCTLSFDETNHLRHRIFWRYGDQHMDMVGSQMTFQHFTFFLTREVFEH
jgi:hypothetical protein